MSIAGCSNKLLKPMTRLFQNPVDPREEDDGAIQWEKVVTCVWPRRPSSEEMDEGNMVESFTERKR